VSAGHHLLGCEGFKCTPITHFITYVFPILQPFSLRKKYSQFKFRDQNPAAEMAQSAAPYYADYLPYYVAFVSPHSNHPHISTARKSPPN
jgi:hypothetical protein